MKKIAERFFGAILIKNKHFGGNCIQILIIYEKWKMKKNLLNFFGKIFSFWIYKQFWRKFKL